jgi:hypothetical protein
VDCRIPPAKKSDDDGPGIVRVGLVDGVGRNIVAVSIIGRNNDDDDDDESSWWCSGDIHFDRRAIDDRLVQLMEITDNTLLATRTKTASRAVPVTWSCS